MIYHVQNDHDGLRFINRNTVLYDGSLSGDLINLNGFLVKQTQILMLKSESNDPYFQGSERRDHTST